MQRIIKNLLLSAVLMLPTAVYSQLSSNPDKFLGNITTDWPGSMDYTSGSTTFKFSDYWNQVTPENGTKWGTVQGSGSNSYYWGGADPAYSYAQQHNFPFKFHTLVWGSQLPEWFKSLSVQERYQAIVNWMDKVKAHFPNLQMIDVVNEAVDGHQGETYLVKEALGGGGETGYDWIIKSFELAAERWPDAILIYNDFNTFQWDTDKYIDLVKTLRNAGAPIDAYGCQSHDLGGVSGSTFGPVMERIHNELQMPMYISEYDISDSDDGNQKWNYMEQFPLMWEADYCAGVTIWGWMYGKTWDMAPNSGLIKDGVERSALKWLRDYMQTDKAKAAKSPFPGMKKEASLYVKPQSLRVSLGQSVPIQINASLRSKTIDHIDFYVNNTLVQTLTQAPYAISYTPADKGTYQLKAVLVATDGSKYERLSEITAHGQRVAHKGVTMLPGTLEFEDFDEGGEGFTYHDSDMTDEGKANYRTDNTGVDIVAGNNSYAIGYTATGEWLEYTVNVTQAGTYSFEAYAAHGNNVQAGFSVSLVTDGQNTLLGNVNVTQTDDNQWSTYNKFSGTFSKPLPAGQQILRVAITGPYINIDKMVLTCTQPTGIDDVLSSDDSSTLPCYDLHGRRVSADNLRPGIYIRGSKKVVIK